MKKIMITGGLGFIGVHLCNYLLDSRYQVIIVDVDDHNYREKFISRDHLDNCRLLYINLAKTKIEDVFFEPVDYIIHLAALPHVDYSFYYPDNTILNNILSLQNVVQYSKKHNAMLLLASSVEVYGGRSDFFHYETTPMTPCSVYGYSKQACENLLQYYVNKDELEGLIVRLTNIYGPLQLPDRVIPRNICRSLDGLSFDLTNYFYRDFVYVKDLVKILVRVLLCGEKGNVYNIASGNLINMKDVIEEIKYYFHDNKIDMINFEQINDGRGRYLRISNEKLKSIYFDDFTTFKEGIKETIAWYADNKDWYQQFYYSFSKKRNTPDFIIDTHYWDL